MHYPIATIHENSKLRKLSWLYADIQLANIIYHYEMIGICASKHNRTGGD
jgi:hypothetical protein